MKRTLIYVIAGVALWVLASFAGTMIDNANAEVWTTSLMVSLIISLLVLPAGLILNGKSSSDASDGSAETDVKDFDADDFSRSDVQDKEEKTSKKPPATIAFQADEVPSKRDSLWPEEEQQEA